MAFKIISLSNNKYHEVRYLQEIHSDVGRKTGYKEIYR